ncbi:MAG: VWA domain-containing protein [Sulfurovum sp.]|nr:VWA domain-containing protein [Sulfurovum sp.]MCB4746374.1 VWA domain-containing protein [Sulfurovum sp.]MCB4749161.1 VWA domain-containing protein [Sulfurovum sp.]MCB4750063.1 VWA domain-containing protein [Sulfurovum sp.]MCB4751455.1 VWA domain-containing protein [Sulfurovum sp.]
MHFTFGSPWFLLFLLLIPCLLWCRTHKRIFYFSKPEWLGKEHPFFSWETWFKILIFTLMIIGLSEPFIYESKENNHKRGRDLILAIDASGSMAQSNFGTERYFRTKYATTISLAKTFVQERFDDNIGVVIFGTFAYTASPLTYDLEALSYLLDMTNVGIAGESTAIGDAIIQSLRTLHFGNAKHKVIILLTDGYHNAGEHAPKEAVEKAKKTGVRIYTIGIGNKQDYDATLLEKIAKETKGKHYSASNAETLKAIFTEISKLEPSKIRSENYLNKKLLIFIPLLLASILLLMWILYTQKEETL